MVHCFVYRAVWRVRTQLQLLPRMAVCDCTVCGHARLFDQAGQDAGSVWTWLCGMRAIVQGDAELSAVGGFLQERASSQPLGVVGRAHKACFDVLPPHPPPPPSSGLVG